MGSDEPGPGQQYALQARKHIASLRKARPGIIIEIRWCPAHKGIAGNEKADEWTKIAAEERTKAKVAPWLPRSLAKLKREITEKKWVEARHWAGTRTPKTKYRMTKIQRPDGVVAGSTKRLASRSYQLKTGHARTGQYLHWAKARTTAQCCFFCFVYSYSHSTYTDHGGVHFARVSCPQSAQWWHVGSSPFALRLGLSQEE